MKELALISQLIKTGCSLVWLKVPALEAEDRRFKSFHPENIIDFLVDHSQLFTLNFFNYPLSDLFSQPNILTENNIKLMLKAGNERSLRLMPGRRLFTSKT